jgi:hypothetical protein
MQDAPALYDGKSPLFSIIIPLESHRGQWEMSWLGWTSQTADTSLYEIILVAPSDFTAREQLKALAGNTTSGSAHSARRRRAAAICSSRNRIAGPNPT